MFLVGKTICRKIYCELIFIRWTFNFVYFMGRKVHKFKIPTNCWFNLIVVSLTWKSKNWRVHEHVHHHQAMKFGAHEIKCFYGNWITWLLWTVCFCLIIHVSYVMYFSQLCSKNVLFMFLMFMVIAMYIVIILCVHKMYDINLWLSLS